MRKITGTLSAEPLIMVRFTSGKTYFFGSLAAIYEMFTKQDIGCPLECLWQRGLFDDGNAFSTDKCTIAKVTVYRKRNKNPRR